MRRVTRGVETNLRLSSTPSTRTPHAGPFPDLGEILIDQGTSDQFLAEQLLPEHLKEACAAKGQPLRLRMQEGYDHSYHFIASFIGDHVKFHADRLRVKARELAEAISHTLQGVEKTNEAIHILESGECLRCVVIY